jgi:transcription elongation factor GreA
MNHAFPVHVTPEGLEKLKRNLDFLKNVRRVEMAENLHEASSGGDTVDNTEYQAALYEQLLLEAQISYLQSTITNAMLIEPAPGSEHVIVGVSVVVQDPDNQLATYRIVGPIEADPSQGRISFECPLGKALLNRKSGDLVKVVTPDGETSYRIVSVA